MTSGFSKKKDSMMIDMVRLNPILYDPNHKGFRNYIMKAKIWETLSNTLHLPLPAVKKRWRHLRDHYHKKAKHERGKTLGKEWEYMRQLEFLSVSRTRSPSDDERDESAALPDDLQSDDSDLPIVPVRKKRKRSECSGAAETSEEKPRAAEDPEPSQRVQPPEVSLVHKFFESMADVVARFPPWLAAETRLKVCQIVTEMELQLHTEQQDPLETSLRTPKQEFNTNENTDIENVG